MDEISKELGGMHLALVDFEKEYEKVCEHVHLVNDYDIQDEEEREQLKSFLFNVYESNTIESMPRCECRNLEGEFYLNMRCDKCGTVVMSPTERPIESFLWMRVPEGIHGFILPQVWIMFQNMFKSGNVSFIDYMTNPYYKPKNKPRARAIQTIGLLNELGWRRSLNNFIENFDWAIEFLINNTAKASMSNREKDEIRLFIAQNKHLFFPRYIPCPNRLLFTVEKKNSKISQVDRDTPSALDAVWTLAFALLYSSENSLRQIEHRVIKTVDGLASYYVNFTRSSIGSKEGLFRRQIFGSRLDYSARTVISSLSRQHRYDEIHLPWGVGIVLLKLHIINKLLRRGFTPVQAQEAIMSHVFRYSDYINEIFNELIAESGGGLPVIFQRNPTLLRGSAQRFFITKIKDDVNDNTISLSVLTLKGFNAD